MRGQRHRARRCALQALYQWSFDEIDTDELIQQFLIEHQPKETDVDYFREIIKGTIQHVTLIDELMSAHLDRDINALNPIELSILRLAIYELLHRTDIPYKVVINEALELTKEFGAIEGYKYVNAILDALAPELRKEAKSSPE